jgi:hypothetical protein
MSFKIVVILFLIIRSIVLELNSKLPNSWFNNFIAGYDKQIEDRGLQGGVFSQLSISKAVQTLLSAGLDPLLMEINCHIQHYTLLIILQNYRKHTLLFGGNFEYFKSSNLFFPASNGVIFLTLA